jgi:hypothetical protein
VESEKVRDLDETSDLGPVKTLQPTPLVDPRIELPQQPPHDLDPTLVLDEGDDGEGPQSTVPPTISASRADQGYPCNLSVYPPVYPHLQDMFQAPLSLNHSNEPAPVVKRSLPTPDSLSPDVVQKLADARVIEVHFALLITKLFSYIAYSFATFYFLQVPQPEQAPTSDVDAGGPIGYPYNLIIYPAIYPHVQDFVYSQLPPSFPACDEASEAVGIPRSISLDELIILNTYYRCFFIRSNPPGKPNVPQHHSLLSRLKSIDPTELHIRSHLGLKRARSV